MVKKVAIQTDSLESLIKASDTSLMLAASFCDAGSEVYFYEPQDMVRKNSSCFTKSRRVHVTYLDHISDFEVLEEGIQLDLNSIDICLVRQNPPFNMEYISSLYALNQLHPRVKVFNDPSGILNNPEKLIPFKFPELMPPTIIVHQWSPLVEEFLKEHEKVVIKPLYSFGGRDVSLMSCQKVVLIKQLIEKLLCSHKPVILQEFLPQIYEGDTRVKIINGKPLAAMKRVPKSGEFLANLAIGGTAHKTKLTKREIEICDALGEYLMSQGIIFAGVDLIAEKLIEVNITSPTGLIAIDKLYDLNLAAKLVDHMLSFELGVNGI